MRAAGVGDRRSPGALVHAMRHTYATRLADNGASASEIMALLGHASLTTSPAYIDSTAAAQRPAVGGFSARRSRCLQQPPSESGRDFGQSRQGENDPPSRFGGEPDPELLDKVDGVASVTGLSGVRELRPLCIDQLPSRGYRAADGEQAPRASS